MAHTLLDYLTVNNSYPVAIDGIEDCPPNDPIFAGLTWARPSISHLQERMRHVYENPKEAKGRLLGRLFRFYFDFSAIGKEARRHMVENYHPIVVARLLNGHLERISNKLLSKSLSGAAIKIGPIVGRAIFCFASIVIAFPMFCAKM